MVGIGFGHKSLRARDPASRYDKSRGPAFESHSVTLSASGALKVPTRDKQLSRFLSKLYGWDRIRVKSRLRAVARQRFRPCLHLRPAGLDVRPSNPRETSSCLVSFPNYMVGIGFEPM